MHQDFTPASKINQEFRKEIRRKDIQRRLAEMRRQMLQQQKCTLLAENGNGVQNREAKQQQNGQRQVHKMFEKLYTQFLQNNKKLNKQQLKQLAKISCSLAGSQCILNLPQQNAYELFSYLFEQFMNGQKPEGSLQQNHALLILHNCLTVAGPTIDSSSPKSKTPQIPSDGKKPKQPASTSNQNFSQGSQYISSAVINSFSTNESFLSVLLGLITKNTNSQLVELTLSALFCVIYNNAPALSYLLVTNNKYLLINALSSFLHFSPSESTVIEILRCFYIVAKKLGFPNLEQFGKMRKFIFVVLNNSNKREIIIFTILSLEALLKSLPNEKTYVTSSGILGIILNKALNLDNYKIIMHAIKIAQLILQNKNPNQINQMLYFIQKCLNTSSVQVKQMSMKLLYDILANSTMPAHFLQAHQSLFNRIIQIFYDNGCQKNLMIQLCCCLSLLSVKNKNFSAQIKIQVQQQIRQILDNWDIDQVTEMYLNSLLHMMENMEEMGEK